MEQISNERLTEEELEDIRQDAVWVCGRVGMKGSQVRIRSQNILKLIKELQELRQYANSNSRSE